MRPGAIFTGGAAAGFLPRGMVPDIRGPAHRAVAWGRKHGMYEG